MIPFEELIAALDRWRMRNGLPVVTGEVPLTPAAPAATPQWAGYAAAAAASAARSAPGVVSPRDATGSDVLDLEDADIASEEEEIYDNEGNDYAMQFGAGAAPATTAPALDEAEGEYASAYEQTHAAQEAYQPAQDSYAPPGSGEYAAQSLEAHPGYGSEEDAEPAIEGEEEVEDWSRMPGYPEDEAAEAGEHDGERTVVGDDRRRDK